MLKKANIGSLFAALQPQVLSISMSMIIRTIVFVFISVAFTLGRRVQAPIEGIMPLTPPDAADVVLIPRSEHNKKPPSVEDDPVLKMADAEHDVVHTESGIEQEKVPLSFSLSQTESVSSSKSFMQSSFAALGFPEAGHTEQIAWSEKAYQYLSITISASLVIFIFFGGSRLMKLYWPTSKAERECADSLCQAASQENAPRMWAKDTAEVLKPARETWAAWPGAEPTGEDYIIKEKVPYSLDVLCTSLKKNISEDHQSVFSVGWTSDETADTSDDDVCEVCSSASEDVPLCSPVTLHSSEPGPTLLTYPMAESLLEYLPVGARVPGVSGWKLCYKPATHGTSMATVHRKLEGCERSLILVRDADDYVFGGFAPSRWQLGRRFHGSGEAFVFSFGKLAPQSTDCSGKRVLEISGGSFRCSEVIEDEKPPLSDRSEDEEQDLTEPPDVDVFPWASSSNRYFMYAERGLLAMGGGDGCYALAIHEGLLCGQSSSTPTFRNPPLSGAAEGDFVLKDMEIWSLE